MSDPAYYLVQSEITRAAFESSPDAIIVVDREGIMLSANQQAEFLTGRPRAQLVGQPIETLVPEDLRQRHQQHRTDYTRMPRRRLMGHGLDLAIMQRTDDGDVPVPVDVNLAPAVLTTGAMSGTIVIATIRTRGGWSGTSAP